MRDFKEKHLTRAYGRSRPVRYFRMLGGLLMLCALGLVAYGSANAAWGMYQKFQDANADDAAIQVELATLKTQYVNASSTVEGLGTQSGLSAAIRERYGLGLPGEREIDIVRSDTSTPSGPAESLGLLQRLWHALFVW